MLNEGKSTKIHLSLGRLINTQQGLLGIGIAYRASSHK